MINSGGWAVVYSGTITEADLLKCLLEGAGIETILQNENVGMIAPYLLPGGAGVHVAIRPEDLEKAKPIVEDYANNKSRRLHET
jgi:hypothetical protein